MPLDLPAARALHDRNPYSPLFCTTCDGVDWPCPTAVALGATGQSEWDNDTVPSCAHGIPYTGACAACLTTAMAPCPDTINCPHPEHLPNRITGADPHCTERHPHAGHCTTPAPAYTPCGHTEGKYATQPCILKAEHWEDHVDHDGNRWD